MRIALDVIRLAHRAEYDVALLFSQDQDLSEVAEEVESFPGSSDAGSRLPALSHPARAAGIGGASTRPIGFGSTGPPTMPAWIAGTTEPSTADAAYIGPIVRSEGTT